MESLLYEHLAGYSNISNYRFGLRPGLSTESIILALKQAVKYLHIEISAYVCILDLPKVFDPVCYNVMWHKRQQVTTVAEVVWLLYNN